MFFFIWSILLGLFIRLTVLMHRRSSGCVKSSMMREISQTMMTPSLVPVTACGELGMKTVWVRVFLEGRSGA